MGRWTLLAAPNRFCARHRQGRNVRHIRTDADIIRNGAVCRVTANRTRTIQTGARAGEIRIGSGEPRATTKRIVAITTIRLKRHHFTGHSLTSVISIERRILRDGKGYRRRGCALAR